MCGVRMESISICCLLAVCPYRGQFVGFSSQLVNFEDDTFVNSNGNGSQRKQCYKPLNGSLCEDNFMFLLVLLVHGC